ncbi:MAG: lmo0937 family membrane protein [Pyrinomonadaceae bacterium]
MPIGVTHPKPVITTRRGLVKLLNILAGLRIAYGRITIFILNFPGDQNLRCSPGFFLIQCAVFRKEEMFMLWTIIIILLVLWALGFGFAGAQVGSLVHILLVIAVIVLVLQLVRGRRV